MKKTFILLILIFTLAACAPSTQTILVNGTPAVVAPNVAALYANQTADASMREADAARQVAESYNQQSTATSAAYTAEAFAPISAITQAAADLAIENMRAAATSTAAQQTAIAGVTQTAMSWTPTPNATATMQAQAFLVQVDKDNAAAQRRQISNTFWAIFLPILALVIILAIAYVAISYSRSHRMQEKPRDQFGKTVPLFDVVNGEYVDLSASANYAHKSQSLTEQVIIHLLEQKIGFASQQPRITAQRQDETKEREQVIEVKRIERSKLPKSLLDSQSMKFIEDSQDNDGDFESKFLLPSWDIINGWQGEGIPYYTARGLRIIDADQHPHLATIGTTRTGKSRRFLRPSIACLLAAGHRVIIIGKSTDYWPFESHPNATLIKISQITKPEEAERYAEILRAIVEEMNRRDEILTASHQSTWSRSGRPQTYIALDEFGNALRLLFKKANIVNTWVESLVAEGAKNGLNILIANQRATGMAGVLSQMGKAIFRVEADEEKHHRSLVGASSLHTGYFMAKFGIPEMAGAFDPSDQELLQFMAGRPVKPLEPEHWIEGHLIEPRQIDVNENAPFIVSTADAPKSEIEQVKEYRAADKSQSDIIRLVWGKTGGGDYWKYVEKYKNILAQLTSSSPQTA